MTRYRYDPVLRAWRPYSPWGGVLGTLWSLTFWASFWLGLGGLAYLCWVMPG